MNWEPIVSLFCDHIIGELTPLLSTGLETITLPKCLVGACSVGLGSLKASGSTLCTIGSSCGCLGS